MTKWKYILYQFRKATIGSDDNLDDQVNMENGGNH